MQEFIYGLSIFFHWFMCLFFMLVSYCFDYYDFPGGTFQEVQFLGWKDPLEKGMGNPLQCSCLENPRDGGAWWAAVYGVAQSRT